MVKCEYTEICAFFNEGMPDRPAIANMMKKKYCARNPSACARYMILKTVGKDRVPVDFCGRVGERVPPRTWTRRVIGRIICA